MKITITIADGNQTVTLKIPLNEILEASKSSSAVVTPDDDMTGTHGQFTRDSSEFAFDDVSSDFENIENVLLSNKLKGMEKGGEKDGLGRIGGMGERKEREDEGRKREGKTSLLRTQSIYTLEFDLADGTTWTPEPKMITTHIALFGPERALEQYLLAQQWLCEKPQFRRSARAMGTFLTKWIKRSIKFEKREQEFDQQASNLLKNGHETKTHW